MSWLKRFTVLPVSVEVWKDRGALIMAASIYPLLQRFVLLVLTS